MKRLGKAFDINNVKYFKGFPKEILSVSCDDITATGEYDNDDFYLPLLTNPEASSFWQELVKKDKDGAIMFFRALFITPFKAGYGFFYNEEVLKLVKDIYKKSQQMQKQLSAIIQNLSTIGLCQDLIEKATYEAKFAGKEYFTIEDFNEYITKSKKMSVFIGMLEKSMSESLEFHIAHELINHPISRKRNIPNHAEIYFTKVLYLYLVQKIHIKSMYRHIADVVNLLFHNTDDDINIKDEDSIKKLLNTTRRKYIEYKRKNREL